MNITNFSSERYDRYLTFILGKELFATDISFVSDIIEVSRIVSIPNSPPYLFGAIKLKGNILPVIDTQMKLGMDENEPTEESCILVVELLINNRNYHIGALVDSVNDVIDLKEEQITRTPYRAQPNTNKFTYGLAKIHNDYVILLNMNMMINEISLEEYYDWAKSYRNELIR